MLYGTRAATHSLARLMISDRVVARSLSEAGFPLGPCSGALPPCGVSGSSPAGTPGRWGAYGAAAAGRTCPAPRTVEAAAATTRVRLTAVRADSEPAVDTGPEYGPTRRQ